MSIYIIKFFYRTADGYTSWFVSSAYFKSREDAEKAKDKLWLNVKNENEELLSVNIDELWPYE